MAWTERYVRADADGAGNGTTDTNSGANGAWTLAQAISSVASGHRVNIRAGTYSNTTTSRTFSTSGTATAPIWWRGFNSSIGDIDSDNTLTKPAITFTTGRFNVSGDNQIFSNLDISGASTVAQVDTFTGIYIHFDRCRIECTGTGGLAVDTDNDTTRRYKFTRCWFKSGSSGDVMRCRVNLTVSGCTFVGGVNGLSVVAGSACVSHSKFRSQGGDGIRVTTATTDSWIGNCTFYNATSDGIEFTVNPTSLFIGNCIFANNGGYGINNSTGTNTIRVVRVHNDFFSNTSGKENGFGDVPSIAERTESTSPFTNAAGNDLSLVPGALAKGSGVPGAFENEVETGYLDIGAVQRKEMPDPSYLILQPTGNY